MRKTLLLVAAILSAVMVGKAQDKKASIGIGFGGASASAKNIDNTTESGFGFNFYLNGMYNLNENLSAGLEYNSNLAVIGNLDGASIEVTKINGILLKGKYKFGTGSVKPFGGLMAGLYTITPGGISSTTSGVSYALTFESKATFGFAPEVGVQFGSFQLATSYHLPGKYKVDVSGTAVETNYSVWQFNIGWNIGLINN